jgi:hypothetical protein
MNWRKVLRWLASYPLDRVARKRRYAAEGPPSALTEAMAAYYNEAMLANARHAIILADRIAGAAQGGELRKPRVMEWRRYGDFVHGEDL